MIVSDDLDMQRDRRHTWASITRRSQAIRAGCDVLLLCCNEQYQAQAEEALIKEAERDSDFRARVGEAAARVRAMKKAHAQNQARGPRSRAT